MLAVIILFVVGFLVGFAVRRWIKSPKPIDITVTAAIWLLIFILGAGVGGNRIVMENLHKLGVWAVLISIGSIAGSVAVVALIQKFIFKK